MDLNPNVSDLVLTILGPFLRLWHVNLDFLTFLEGPKRAALMDLHHPPLVEENLLSN